MTRYLVAMVLFCSVARGGEYTTVWDDGDMHMREWTECRIGLPEPSGWGYWPGLKQGVDGTGVTWSQSGVNMSTAMDVNNLLTATVTQSIDAPQNCTGFMGWWSWKVYWRGNTEGMSYWLRPGNLSMDFPNDPYNISSPTDAADAAVMFLYWGTPVADLTGDAMTDAADAGRLFSEWSGDTVPHSVPEPTGLLGLFPLALLYHRHKRTFRAS